MKPIATLILNRNLPKVTDKLYRTIKKVMPDIIYNEADQDHVSWSYELPNYSFDITGAAVGKILEMIKDINIKIKYYFLKFAA